MRRRTKIALLAGAGLGLLATQAHAAEPGRPNEDEMFGGAAALPPVAKPADAKPAAPAAGTGGAGAPSATGSAISTEPSSASPPPVGSPGAPVQPVAPADTDRGTARDVDLLGDPNAGPKLSQEVAPDDPLKIGGQIYLRALYNNPGSADFANLLAGNGSATYKTFSAPSLLDAYFDARPNDRVRGFVLGRLFFDPTLASSAAPTTASTNTSSSGGTMGDTDMTGSSMMNLQNVNLASLGVSGVSNTRGPSSVLDQMWLRFDIAHTVFITVGRQHVRWGTGRFWTPTDFLHPVHRNPVAVFDARPGFTMLKLHLPWEERGWNFYAFGLFEGVPHWDGTSYPAGSDVVSTLGQIGGAARAELVFGPAELGLDAVVYDNQKARYGVDLSFGIGDFDFYGDAGFRYGSEIPRVTNDIALPPAIYYSVGIKPQVVAGTTYSLKYNDNDVFTLAGEYFYNALGYSDPHAYVNLFTSGLFEFFYTGRHYAAFSAILNAPWSWNYSNFSFTQIGNMSDQSFISRVDYSYTLLTHMTFEAFGAMNYGHREGEFRLGFDNVPIAGANRTLLPQSFSLGLGLRVKI